MDVIIIRSCQLRDNNGFPNAHPEIMRSPFPPSPSFFLEIDASHRIRTSNGVHFRPRRREGASNPILNARRAPLHYSRCRSGIVQRGEWELDHWRWGLCLVPSHSILCTRLQWQFRPRAVSPSPFPMISRLSLWWVRMNISHSSVRSG